MREHERRSFGRVGAAGGPVALPRRDGINVFRTSFAQERVWFVEQVAGGSAAYNVVGAFEARGRLDLTALRASLAAAIGRHETLRTTFVAMDGRPMQVISPIAPIGMTVRDLRTSSDASMRTEIEREIQHPFDVTRGPLVRLRVLVTGAESSVVLLAMHHLVADAWSVGILVRELCALYRAAVGGRPAELSRMALQYADYSEWQRHRADGSHAEELRRYWRAQLAGAAYPSVAAGDRLRFQGGAERCELDRALVLGIRAAARRASITPFAVALAAWTLVLRRWTGLDDVTVLSPVANRERTELADVVGFFVNLLALRTRLDGDPNVRELLQRVGTTVRDAVRHQALPFELVLGILGVDRTLSRPPLSPFAFAIEPSFEAAIDLPDVALRALPFESGIARTDLALVVCERGDAATARLEYDRSIYAPADAARLLRDFRACLGLLLDDPARPCSALLPAGGEVASSTVDAAPTVWGGFTAQVHRTPYAIAVRAGTRAVTYERLAADARRCAGALRSFGAGREVIVAVRLERGIEWVTSVLGIWGAGAIYLPLDPRWPAARMRDVLERSGARIVLVDGDPPVELRHWAAGDTARRLVAVDASWLSTASAADGHGPAPNDAAYVLYTSGSSGIPKGALVEHAGLANHLAAKVDLLGLGIGDRVAQSAPASFDVSLWQWAAPLLVGAEVVVLDDATATDPTALREAIRGGRLTVLELVPSVLELVLDVVAPEGDGGFASLRWLVATGEALSPALCRRWLARHPEIPLVNAYGPTECADDVTHHVIRTPPPSDAVRVPIGRPIAGMQVAVLDDRLQPVAAGVAGEICVSGVGVARGYLADPERTAAAFITLAGSDAGSRSRWYRTGDLGRRLPDGTLEWLGRLDTQVKIRGVRIEPEEVEAVLLTHRAVRRAVVVAEPPGTPSRLVAHVETTDDATDLAEELRAWLATRLPDAMIPGHFVAHERLPVTAHGKLDRRALATAVDEPQAVPRAGRAPESATERLLASLWCEVLGVEVASVTANFFALGGDSLATIRLVAVARRHGVVFTPQTVFEHQTIAALAAAATAGAAPPAEQGLVVGDFEPTPIQRMLLGAELDDVHHYNLSMLLAVERRLDATALAVAVEHLLRHHDLLRFRARRDAGGWHTTIAGLEGAVPYRHVDLAALDDRAASAAIEAAAREAQASLDLDRGPVVRVVSFDLGSGRPGRVLVVVHHLACDVASWPILLEDLAAVYAQVAAGEPIVLPAKTTSYRAWAEHLAVHARSDALAAEAAFWERECATPGARLPRIGAAAGGPTVADVGTVVVELDPDVSTRVLDTLARLGATVETALLTGLATILTREGSDERLLVYLERHGREPLSPSLDVSRTVGWFTAVFPVCVRVAASGRPRDTLIEIERHLRAIPNGGVGWGLLGTATRSRSESGAGRRPEVSCNYLGRVEPPAGSTWTIAPESPGPEVGAHGTRPTSLDVVGALAGGRLRVAWHYDTATQSEAVIARFAAECRDVLRALADDEIGEGRAS